MFNGATCPRALGAVLSEEPTTGRRWADLLSVSTLVLFRPSFPETDLMQPPEGWSLSAVTDYTVVWTRDERLPTAGGVVATSAQSAVTEELVTDRVVRLRVTSVGPDGGSVTLSRLAWPGYSVEGSSVAPLEGIARAGRDTRGIRRLDGHRAVGSTRLDARAVGPVHGRAGRIRLGRPQLAGPVGYADAALRRREGSRLVDAGGVLASGPPLEA